MTQTMRTVGLNTAAEFLPQHPHEESERPALRVADVLVFVYVEDDPDHDDGMRLVVSVDLDDVGWGHGPQGVVPMRINVQGNEVYRGSDRESRGRCGVCGGWHGLPDDLAHG